MHEDNCAVYVHVNLINGKKYFGITTQNPENRWKNGYGYYRNAHFMSAIKKYGWSNFGHFILYKNIPVAIAKNIEEMLIREHMSYDRNFGYNRTSGGELEKRNEEARERQRRAVKEAMNRPEVREKISAARKGRKLSEETRQRLSESHKKPVVALDPETGERVHFFESTVSAGRAGFHQGHVSECCCGTLKTHKGYVWRHVEEVNDDDGDN